MRLTMRTSLALRTLMLCAVNPGRIVRRSEIAVAVNASEHHLAQVIHQLGRLNYLETLRGRRGGLRLARPAAEISVGAVVRATEVPRGLTECLGPGGDCPLTGACPLSCLFSEALEAFHNRLDPVTLAELVEGNAPLHALLKVV